ncbi:MAG: hypothetical protein K1Y36_14950 [Blastocatellia bacterium]|nr:hypothetical protein [Blastocatellia bacterium]
MGLLDKFFSAEEKGESKPEIVAQSVEEVALFASDTARRICSEDKFPDDERQAVHAAYTFGAVYGVGQQHSLIKADMQKLAEAVFRSSLMLSDEEIGYKIPPLLKAIDPKADKLLNMIIYQGKKAFLSWRTNRGAYNGEDFRQAVQIFKRG